MYISTRLDSSSTESFTHVRGGQKKLRHRMFFPASRWFTGTIVHFPQPATTTMFTYIISQFRLTRHAPKGAVGRYEAFLCLSDTLLLLPKATKNETQVRKFLLCRYVLCTWSIAATYDEYTSTSSGERVQALRHYCCCLYVVLLYVDVPGGGTFFVFSRSITINQPVTNIYQN